MSITLLLIKVQSESDVLLSTYQSASLSPLGDTSSIHRHLQGAREQDMLLGMSHIGGHEQCGDPRRMLALWQQ